MAETKIPMRHEVEGYENFCNFMNKLDYKDKSVYVLFSGSKLPTGENWCIDCIKAKPVIEEALQKYSDSNTYFIYVEVGDRTFWKDLNCPFRKDDRLRLMVIPTMLKWDTPRRLEGVEQCGKLDLLELLFMEE